MAQAGDRQQGDHRPVVRQGVHAAAGHGGDTVQYLERNIGGVGGGDKVSDIAARAMLIPRRPSR